MTMNVKGLLSSMKGSNISELRFYGDDPEFSVDPSSRASDNLILTVELPKSGEYDTSILATEFLFDNISQIRVGLGNTLLVTVGGGSDD